MKAKKERRGRPAAHQGGGPPRSAEVRGTHSLRSRLLLVLGLAATVAGAWLGASLWKSSDRLAMERTSVPKAGRSETPGSTASSHAPHANNDDAKFRNRVNQGNELLAKGKPAEAAQVLTEAMRMNPKDEDVHYHLGVALARLGKFDQAIQQYEEALRLLKQDRLRT